MNNELNIFIDDLDIFLKKTQGLLINNSEDLTYQDNDIVKKLYEDLVSFKNGLAPFKNDTRSFKESEYLIKEMSNDTLKTKEDETAFIIRKNKFNNFVFKNTSYIFKSHTEKYIVAIEGLNGEWLPLTDEDKLICKNKYKLRCKDLPHHFKTSIDKDVLKQIKLPYEVAMTSVDKVAMTSVDKVAMTSVDKVVKDKHQLVVNDDNEIEVDD